MRVKEQSLSSRIQEIENHATMDSDTLRLYSKLNDLSHELRSANSSYSPDMVNRYGLEDLSKIVNESIEKIQQNTSK